MSRPSYDKLVYAASILGEARRERQLRAKEADELGREEHRQSWEESASRLAEVIAWLDGGAP